jgi:hypothetical protein
MPAMPVRLTLCALLLTAPLALPCRAAGTADTALQKQALQDSTIRIEGLGKGTVALAGPWQFHLGDNAAWARPGAPDATGVDGWEQLRADKTWGAQGHPSYEGFGWYRLHLQLDPAPGAAPDFAMMMRGVEDVYEVYWNGQLVGHHGKMPPDPVWHFFRDAQTFSLGPAREGVLAVRVWKAPLQSFDSDQLGGLPVAPELGSPAAIGARHAQLAFTWLRSRQFFFALLALNLLVCVLSVLVLVRNWRQPVLLAMATYTGAKVASNALTGIGLPVSYNFAIGALQPFLALDDIGLWFLLIYLLRLNEHPRIVRLTWVLAWVFMISGSLDGALSSLDWSNPLIKPWVQTADGILTAIFSLFNPYALVLIVMALVLRKRMDLSRILLAATACTADMILLARITLEQGERFTHWTIGERIVAPLFEIDGNPINSLTIAETLLLIAIVYAVFCYVRDAGRRHVLLEQEFKSARELQQVLIPEALPEIPGYAVTSAYKPAQEVGGDFFQIIALEGEHAGSTLVVLGDVSGKGLKAAMTVSLIVGAVRTLAKYAPQPAALLAELNQRMCGRMQDGFTTCLAMLLTADGRSTVASAGHPAPFLNDHEVELPGALPLGLVSTAAYPELALELREGDHLSLYTDGLLEARSGTGELFSFARVDALFAGGADAARATETAVDFGQEDDITVLTLTRLGSGVRSTTQLSSPVFSTI